MTFNKLQVRYNIQGCYHYTAISKKDDPKCTHIHSQRGNSHPRVSGRNNRSPKEGEGTQSWEISVGDVSTHGESL